MPVSTTGSFQTRYWGTDVPAFNRRSGIAFFDSTFKDNTPPLPAQMSVLMTLCRRGAGIFGNQQIQEANDLFLLAFLIRSRVRVFRELR